MNKNVDKVESQKKVEHKPSLYPQISNIHENAISKLYELAKQRKLDEPWFANDQDLRNTEEYTVTCHFIDKVFVGQSTKDKKDAKKIAASKALDEILGTVRDNFGNIDNIEDDSLQDSKKNKVGFS